MYNRYYPKYLRIIKRSHMIGRRTVSYFEPQFNSTAINRLEKFFDDSVTEHMVDIKNRGFDEIVLFQGVTLASVNGGYLE